MEIKLKGLPAVLVAILAIGGFVGYRMFLQRDLALSDKVRREIKLSLTSEISGAISRDAEGVTQALDRGDKASAAKLAQRMRSYKVVVEDLSMRGSGEDIRVRAHYKVHGPDGVKSKVGYFKFSHSAITGWRYEYETTAFSYHMKLW